MNNLNTKINLNLYEKTNITRFAKIKNPFKEEIISEKIKIHQVEMINFEKLLDSIKFDLLTK